MPKKKWRGVLALEGIPTGDGRMIEAGALEFAELPLPLRVAREDNGAHLGAIVVGSIDTVERRDGGVIWGEGTFDTSPDADEAVRLMAAGMQRGVSVDLDSISFELRVAEDALDFTDTDVEADADGRVTLFEVDREDELFIMTEARLRAATIVATPAFAEAVLEVTDENGDPLVLDADDDLPDEVAASAGTLSLVAAVEDWRPDHTAFARREFDGPTPLTVDGQHVYGHLATWGTCHIGFGEACVTAPRSATDYAYFHTSEIQTDRGPVAVGRLTVGGGHAAPGVGWRPAVDHYDNVGTCAAFVTVWEDEHGIAFAGVLNPDADDDTVEQFRAAPLSGDWRRIAGNLELVAACAVNTPGFPVPRGALAASGEQTSLVAAGTLSQTLHKRPVETQVRDIALAVAQELRRLDEEATLNAEAEALAAEVYDALAAEIEASVRA